MLIPVSHDFVEMRGCLTARVSYRLLSRTGHIHFLFTSGRAPARPHVRSRSRASRPLTPEAPALVWSCARFAGRPASPPLAGVAQISSTRPASHPPRARLARRPVARELCSGSSTTSVRAPRLSYSPSGPRHRCVHATAASPSAASRPRATHTPRPAAGGEQGRSVWSGATQMPLRTCPPARATVRRVHHRQHPGRPGHPAPPWVVSKR